MADFTPSFRDISPQNISTPVVSDWFDPTDSITVPDTIAPYLAAHGYLVTGGQRDIFQGEFTGWQVTMQRKSFEHDEAIQDMLTRMTDAYNDGRRKNDLRYEDLVENFSDLISKAQSHMTSAKTALTDELTLHATTLSSLDDDYEDFFADVKADLEGLTTSMDADRTRANDAFDTQVTKATQGLVDRGFYSSAMLTTITAGIEERRQLALTTISETEAKLKADLTLRKNEIYINVLKMREGLVSAQIGLTNREQEFLAYQLDTQNNLAMAMFKTVEAREDGYPGFGDQVALVTSLGDDT